MKIFFIKSQILAEQKNKFYQFFAICRLGRLNKKWLAISFVFLLIATTLEGFSFSLLVPFLKQASNQGSYEGWRNIPVVSDILARIGFSQWSSRIEWLLAVIVVIACLRQVILYVSQVLYQSVTLTFETRIRAEGFERMLTFGCGYFDRQKKGEIHNILMRYTQEISAMLADVFFVCQHALFGLIYAVVLLKVSPQLCLISIILIPLFYFTFRGILKKIHALYRKILKQEQKNHGVSYDIFSNIKLIKGFAQEDWEKRQFFQHEKGRAKDGLMAYALYYLISPVQEIFITLGITVIIWISYLHMFKNDPAFLIKLIVSLLLFRRTLSAVNAVLTYWAQILRRVQCFQEFYQLLTPSADKEILIEGTKSLTEIANGIQYAGVTMRYKGQKNVLNGVSFFIPKGSFTAIVGTTGSGKTTIADLLLRFYEYQEGDILIDGVSLRDYSLKSLRGAIGQVSQETLVLNDTVFNNIKYAKPEASESEIMEAAKNAHVLEFLARQNDGMQTVVGDKGVKLSGGELQRLSLARVFLRDPKILILDEATSALDSISEKLIQSALHKLTRYNRIIIAIAHRLSTIAEADRILVLENGRIVEQGTKEKLLETKGAFYKFWQAQQVIGSDDKPLGC